MLQIGNLGFKPVSSLIIHKDIIVNFGKLVGEEPFSRIFEGTSKKTRSKLQVKFIDLTKNPLLKSIIQKEVNILERSSKNENVVKLIEYTMDATTAILVTENLTGTTLDMHLRKHGTVSEQEAIKFVNNIIHGMKVLNDLDLVHGNLNSSSVFVHQGYKAAIVKFTNFYYSTHFSALTNFGDAIPMHILAYISPETLKDKKYNEKTEIWSLGMLYYEMLYGVKPWSGNTREELICNIYQNELKFPESPKVSENTIDFITKCLNRNKDERPSWGQLFEHRLIFRSLFMQSDKTYKPYNEEYGEMSPKKGKLVFGMKKSESVSNSLTIDLSSLKKSREGKRIRDFAKTDRAPRIKDFAKTDHTPSQNKTTRKGSMASTQVDSPRVQDTPRMQSARETVIARARVSSIQTTKSTLSDYFGTTSTVETKGDNEGEDFELKRFQGPFEESLNQAKIIGETLNLLAKHKENPIIAHLLKMFSDYIKDWNLQPLQDAKSYALDFACPGQTTNQQQVNSWICNVGLERYAPFLEVLASEINSSSKKSREFLNIAFNIKTVIKSQKFSNENMTTIQKEKDQIFDLYRHKRWSEIKKLLTIQ